MIKTYKTGLAQNRYETLRHIVNTGDIRKLEQFCWGRTYAEVRDIAEKANIDLDELEELLGKI